MALTDKQRRYVDEYLPCPNANVSGDNPLSDRRPDRKVRSLRRAKQGRPKYRGDAA
jgi:hypothetical protein